MQFGIHISRHGHRPELVVHGFGETSFKVSHRSDTTTDRPGDKDNEQAKANLNSGRDRHGKKAWNSAAQGPVKSFNTASGELAANSWSVRVSRPTTAAKAAPRWTMNCSKESW